MMTNTIGIIGVAMIIITYLLLQIEKIDPKGFLYSFINAFGSFLIVYSLLENWNLASFIIEFFWITISLYGLYRWYKRRKLSY